VLYLGFGRICPFRNRGTEYITEYGMTWMSRSYKATMRPSPSSTARSMTMVVKKPAAANLAATTPGSFNASSNTARAGNRRFWRLTSLRAHAKVPYKTDLHRKTLRTLKHPRRARTVEAAARPQPPPDHRHQAVDDFAPADAAGPRCGDVGRPIAIQADREGPSGGGGAFTEGAAGEEEACRGWEAGEGGRIAQRRVCAAEEGEPEEEALAVMHSNTNALLVLGVYM
jgi:hypothetical protein